MLYSQAIVVIIIVSGLLQGLFSLLYRPWFIAVCTVSFWVTWLLLELYAVVRVYDKPPRQNSLRKAAFISYASD